MLFNSYLFILVFLPLALGGYFILGHYRQHETAKGWLLLASLVFYGWWNPMYLLLLGASVTINFCFSTVLRDKKWSGNKKILFAFLLFNIALLAYFKYANFFVDNFNALAGSNWHLAKVVLPLAISFFTLQQIAYLVDVYEGLVEERSFLDYALFITFFPQLIAGPIVHHREMMPQFADATKRLFNGANFSLGFFIFSVGLFKKVVIADPFSVWVNAGYGMAENLSVLDAWVSSLSYTFQMYFDFSGYADMAIGLGLMANIKIPKNFDSPYRATSIINYWDRWHITLTRFINAYIYTPILRSCSGKVTYTHAMLATFIAMLISGLWHGAAWTFVLWGMFHGFALVINHLWRRRKTPLPYWGAWFLTFLFVNFSLVIFRSENIPQLFAVIKAMLGFGAYAGHALDLQVVTHISFDWRFIRLLNGLPDEIWAAVALGGALCLCLFGNNSAVIQERFKPNVFYFVAQLFLFAVSFLMLSQIQEFIYFNF